MAYKSCLVGRVFAVRWVTTELEDLTTVRDELKAAYKARGERLIYLSVSAEDAPPPAPNVRSELLRTASEVLNICEDFFIIIETRGFRGSVQRSAMAGMLLLYKDSARIKVRSSVTECLLESAHKLRVDRTAVEAALRQQGITKAPAA